MLELKLPNLGACFNETTNEFVECPEVVIQLEHSLVSISKWEQKYHKSFIATRDKSTTEMYDYIRFMTLNGPFSDEVYARLTSKDIDTINKYMDDPATATILPANTKETNKKKIITNEEIYQWMISANIPFECQYWHINRLMTLIEVCGLKNSPPKKMSNREIWERNARLNAERRAKMHTKG